MSPKLKVLYFGSNTPKKLPSEDKEKVVVVVPGSKWTLICNGAALCGDILTYPFSQFVSTTRKQGFGQYPHVCLDMEGITFSELMDILSGMGFNLKLQKEAPNFQ
ncbi:hypothetical protein GYA27_00125 [candidate division WWE3 bacterium]|uniref:Uncharacterized protein n=1 Tax=candidate division WWE3 bacterium TaxID=2053526 RepID=A0A7X9DJU7_UNCKA|nr:hypothetical protein [candidate division WWE3 bacterium]